MSRDRTVAMSSLLVVLGLRQVAEQLFLACKALCICEEGGIWRLYGESSSAMTSPLASGSP